MKYNEIMVILAILLAVLLLIISATRPIVLDSSEFEIRRQEKAGLLTNLNIRRNKYADDVRTLVRVFSAVLLVLFVPVSISAFGWVIGTIVGVVLALEYQAIARLKVFRLLADKLYSYTENFILNFTEKSRWLFIFLKSMDDSINKKQQVEVYSKEELTHVIKKSSGVLSASEVKLVNGALSFGEKLVHDVMTPRSVIDSISHDELLGPVTLSELHKTGHSRFPVIDGDIDHVVGMLYVRNLLTVDSSKSSQRVSEVMDKTVCYVRDDQTLEQALAAYFKTKKLLFVVINEFRETVGLLSLEDVIEELIGQKINDEFEKHSDLRAVAERNPRKNNATSKTRQDV